MTPVELAGTNDSEGVIGSNAGIIKDTTNNKCMEIVDSVESDFDSLMHIGQSMAELAQSKVESVQDGECLPGNILLAYMLYKAGKEFEDLGHHLVFCSDKMKEGHYCNLQKRIHSKQYISIWYIGKTKVSKHY